MTGDKDSKCNAVRHLSFQLDTNTSIALTVSSHHTTTYNADDHGSYMCGVIHARQIKAALLTIAYYPNPQKTTHLGDTSSIIQMIIVVV